MILSFLKNCYNLFFSVGGIMVFFLIIEKSQKGCAISGVGISIQLA